MVKSTENSKLYEIVIQTLSNYEASYNAADWEQMQSLLDLAPKSKSFKLKHILLSFSGTLKSIPKSKTFKFIFSLYSLIGVAILIGVYFLYTFLNSPKTPNPINSTPQQKNENAVNAATSPVLAPPTKSVQGNPKEDKTQKPINTVDSAHAAIKTDLLKSNESVITKKENKEKEKSGVLKTENADANQQNLKSAKADSLNSSGGTNRNDPSTNLNNNQREKSISDSVTRYLNLQPQDSLKIPK